MKARSSAVFRKLPLLLFLLALLTAGMSALPSRLSAVSAAEDEAKFELRPGDHISYIGNTLADRMQHVGWLETLIQHRFPQYQLSFRNLGFPGDEVDKRPRSDNFGSPDEWLTKVETDVVFAFLGYNESFAGEAGLEAFRNKLKAFIDHTRSQKYNGQSPPRIVLFSPVAHEDLKSPHLPDGTDNNRRLQAYTQAMADVAAEKNVPFVDLFHPTRQLYAENEQPLTINGVHLSPAGNRLLAEVIAQALFGESPAPNEDLLERIRGAVVDKNFHWFNLYRTVDGYNVFGGRSKLSWFGQSNADVMQREMEIFNVMAQNRDKLVWAIARGSDAEVDDSNTPPLLEVKTNKPGPLPDGSYPFLGAEEAIEKMQLADGLQANLFASEEQFPELVNPVQMSVDPDGRLWVATWPTYPHWNPKEDLRDKIVILPDEDRDGKADRLIVFADGLNSVTGFEFWGGGILVAAAPELLFLKDTDGDDKADVKIRMLQGISAEDTHHTANSLTIGPDGGLYFSHGIFHVDNMETPTRTFRSTASGVYRFDPRTFEIDFHFPIGPNPHGIAFDQWGYQFATDGTSGTGSYISIGKGVGAPKQWYQKRVRPVAATGFLSSSHFPEHNHGNFLICNTIGVLGVLQHRVEYDGADINAVEIEPIVLSSDPNFRPTDVEVGGDGGLYISDWANPLIGHMQHNIRDPNRDHAHGRVYRVTAKGRELLEPVKMVGQPIEQVLSAFYARENGTRYRARLELSGRETSEVTEAVSQWTAKIEPGDAADEQALLESLWVFEEHRVPNETLLKKVFAAHEPRVRAAAIRTLGHWGEAVESWQPILSEAAQDPSPLVRAEAVKAAVSFQGLAAAEAFFEVATRPTDVQIDFVLNYARGKLNIDSLVQEALKQEQPLSLAAQAYVLRNASVADLMKMDPSEAVYRAILSRPNVPPKTLTEALNGLAKMRKESPLPLLLNMIEQQDAEGQTSNLDTLGSLLLERPSAELQQVRERLIKLATEGQADPTRQAAYAAWVIADGSPTAAYNSAAQTKEGLRDLLESMGGMTDPELRAAMYGLVRPLMFELPGDLASETGGSQLAENGIRVDYYQPHGRDAARETLAAMKPKASGVVPEIQLDVPQLQTRDAFALRFTGSLLVDKPGKYRFYTNSDDGSRLYVGDELVVNNDGLHGMVEKSGEIELPAGNHPLLVTYFDNGGGDGLVVSWSGPGIQKQTIAADRLSVSGAETIHDVAIRALSAIPGHEPQKFADLATLIKAGRHRTSAIRAMLSIPPPHWDSRQARALADNLVAYVSEIPAQYRTGAVASDAMQLVDLLAEKLPPSQAEAIRERLENLDVRVIAIGTVPHRMIYDKEKIVVQAGRTVEFRFSNTDNMPHNFAITEPGALEEVGLLAEATAQDPDAMQRQYVPKTDKILLASQLLQPEESQAMTFQVPQEPGVYPYVCTYPGHWRRMYGALYVVADRPAYEADPEAYLSANPLPLKDELLKLLQRDTPWKYEDLADAIAELESGHGQGRSYEVGKQLFKLAACVSCHKMDGEGAQVGPDLSKLDPKRTLPEVLRDVLEPSLRIDEKYQSQGFLMASGKVLTGLVVAEDENTVKVVTNPLTPDKPQVIRKDEIEDRAKSKVSIMPQGVLNKLTEEEILDLIAYVYARGKKEHKLFEKHHH